MGFFMGFHGFSNGDLTEKKGDYFFFFYMDITDITNEKWLFLVRIS
jgi:hypothetical protein